MGRWVTPCQYYKEGSIERPMKGLKTMRRYISTRGPGRTVILALGANEIASATKPKPRPVRLDGPVMFPTDPPTGKTRHNRPRRTSRAVYIHLVPKSARLCGVDAPDGYRDTLRGVHCWTWEQRKEHYQMRAFRRMREAIRGGAGAWC